MSILGPDSSRHQFSRPGPGVFVYGSARRGATTTSGANQVRRSCVDGVSARFARSPHRSLARWCRRFWASLPVWRVCASLPQCCGRRDCWMHDGVLSQSLDRN
ncbi:hypothetical protein [Lysobacter gummosus]|uniref:hypothetical protein n=1 Tax=Lysobacter gummosus TaxID=262324 RepID=UPI00362940B2